MARIETHAYTIDVHGLFEKVVQYGQLLRAERLDRAPDERSFGELNLFVGLLGEETLGVADDAAPDAQLDALYGKQLEKEKQLGDLIEGFCVRDEQGATVRSALWKLTPQSWRPDSGFLLELRVFPGTAPGCMAFASLEFDWLQRDAYEAAWAATLGSIQWKPEHLNGAGIEALKGEVYSIFDEMPKEQRLALAERFNGIIGRKKLAVPVEPSQAPETIDMRSGTGAPVNAAIISKALEGQHGDHGDVFIHVDFLPEPVKLTCYLEEDGPEVAAKRAARLANAVAALRPDQHPAAAQYLWENCKMNFDATDYGYGEGRNEDHFGIHGPEEALLRVGQASVYSHDDVNDDVADGDFVFALDFYPPWEDEHGCSLAVRGGRVLRSAMPGDMPEEWRDEKGE